MLLFDPTPITPSVVPGVTFVYRSEGTETALLADVHGQVPVTQLSGFSLTSGDGIDVGVILQDSGIKADLTNIQNYVSLANVGGNTQLWFDKLGSGHGGTLEAVLQGVNVTMPDLLAHNALHLVI